MSDERKSTLDLTEEVCVGECWLSGSSCASLGIVGVTSNVKLNLLV